MDRETAMQRIYDRNVKNGKVPVYEMTDEETRALLETADDPIARERRAHQASIDSFHRNPPSMNGAPIVAGFGSDTPEGRAQRDAFRDYVKTGAENRAALVAGTGANGGFVVPEPLHAPLIEKFRKQSAIYGNATMLPMNGNTSMYLPYKATPGTVVSTTEAGARTEQTEPTFTGGASTQLQAFDYYTDQRASQTFLDDIPDAEQWLLDAIYQDFIEQLGVDLAVGAGSGSQKPTGMFTATTFYTTVLSGSAGAVTNTGIAALFAALPPKYWPDAVWVMNPATFGVVWQLNRPNLNNTPLVTENEDGSYTMMGRPILIDSSAPAIGATAYPIAFGDLSRGYVIGVHKQPVILRDPFTAKPNVIFYGLGRFGGVPWDPNAVVLLKSNNS